MNPELRNDEGSAELTLVVVCASGLWCSIPKDEANAAEHIAMFDADTVSCGPHRTGWWSLAQLQRIGVRP